MTTPRDESYAKKRAYYLRNREKIIARSREYYRTHRAERNASNKAYRMARREELNEYSRNYNAANRDQHVARNKKWRDGNPEKAKSLHRRGWLRRKYGITLAEWDSLFRKQDDRCAVCGSPDPGKQPWHLDHDHHSGKVRGILCHLCNSLLGYARDNPVTLLSAIHYLMAPPARQSMNTTLSHQRST